MKITFNNSRSKPRKKTIRNLIDSKTITAANRRSRTRIPTGIPRDLIYGQYQNTPLIERIGHNSLNSDVEFFLTSSEREPELPRSGKCVEIPLELQKTELRVKSGSDLKSSYCDKMNQIFDKKCGIEELNGKTMEDVDLSDLINSKDDNLKKILYKIPHYFYRLKNEYVSYKGKYEKAAADLEEQKRITESLQKRAIELVEEDKRKSERILSLTDENEILKRYQIEQESYEKERAGLIEIFKMDGEKRKEDIKQLLEENSKLKCEKSKMTVEMEMQRRMLREEEAMHAMLKGESEVLRAEIGNVEFFARNTLERYVKSDLFIKIEQVTCENRKVIYYRQFYETVKGELSGMRLDVARVEEAGRAVRILVEHQCCRMDDLIMIVNRLKDERIEMHVMVEKIRKQLREVQTEMNGLCKVAEEISSAFPVDGLKKEFSVILQNQRREFEVMKQGYERRIKEASVMEEDVDIWDVFE